MRVWLLKPQTWHYVMQLSIRGSRDNARGALVDLQQARSGVSPLITALLAMPPQQRSQPFHLPPRGRQDLTTR